MRMLVVKSCSHVSLRYIDYFWMSLNRVTFLGLSSSSLFMLYVMSVRDFSPSS